jgi:hypothetical protein
MYLCRVSEAKSSTSSSKKIKAFFSCSLSNHEFAPLSTDINVGERKNESMKKERGEKEASGAVVCGFHIKNYNGSVDAQFFFFVCSARERKTLMVGWKNFLKEFL